MIELPLERCKNCSALKYGICILTECIKEMKYETT